MSTSDTVSTVFDAQRETIKQSRQAIEESAELQKHAVRVFIDWLDAGQVLQRQGLQLAKTSLDAYFDTVEATIPGSNAALDEVREASDEGFERVVDIQNDVWVSVERIAEEGADSYGAVADAYVDSTDSAFDAFLEAHERTEAQITAAADTAAEAVEVEIED